MNRELRRKQEAHLKTLAKYCVSRGLTAEHFADKDAFRDYIQSEREFQRKEFLRKGYSTKIIEENLQVYYGFTMDDFLQALRAQEGGRKSAHRKVIAIDFDGCLCTNGTYPNIGSPNFRAIRAAKQAKKNGAALILWTCREGELLDEAVAWCKDHGLEFDAVNQNLPERIEREGTDPRKIAADVYWDDKAKLVAARAEDEGPEPLAQKGLCILACLTAPNGTKVELPAILDTGANHSCISEEVAQKLKLKPAGTAIQWGVGGKCKTNAYIANITFPDISKKNHSVKVTTIKSQDGAAFGLDCGFVIGRDIMKSWHFVWDGPASQVQITEEDGAPCRAELLS